MPYSKRVNILKIAIDFDDTFSANEMMWTEIVQIMQKFGCDVRFVTARVEMLSMPSYNQDIRDHSKALNIPIIYTEGDQKREHWDADIWCDDMPEAISTISQMQYMVDGWGDD